MSEVIDISPRNLDSSLYFFQPSISHDVLCIEVKYTALKYSFPDLEPVSFSVSSSNCCFLTCIEISQEAGHAVFYSHLFKNFPQFFVIHRDKGFGIADITEVDVLLELSCFFNDPTDVVNLISASSNFSKSSLNIWKFMVHILLKPRLENFEYSFVNL